MGFQLCLNAAGGRFDVPWGTDEALLAAVALGARGAVGSTYNFAAPVYHRLLEAAGRGDSAAAREHQFRSVRLVQVLAGHGFMAAARAVMGMLGVPVGPPRLPHAPLTEERTRRLESDLADLGFFDWVRV
jgi:N-acetylneuraminate lyase